MSQSLEKLSFHAKASLRNAEKLARSCSSNLLEPEHLLAAIYLERGSVGSLLLQKIGFCEEIFDGYLSSKGTQDTKDSQKKVPLSKDTKHILTTAFRQASHTGSSYVGTEHFIEPLLHAKREDVQKLIARTTHPSFLIARKGPGASAPHALPGSSADMTDIPLLTGPDNAENASALEHFCIHINEQVRGGAYDAHIGREREITELIHILGRKRKNNALLIGEPGVGKTALAHGLAERIESNNVPPFLLGKSLYELDLGLLIAGTTFRGEFEDRLKSIIEEVRDDPNVILFIDEIHTLSGAGAGSGGLDAANMLKPALARGELKCIGATTLKEYKKYFEKDAALNRRFQTIHLDEPTQKETRAILMGLKRSFEKHHNVFIEDSAIDTAITLSERYLPEKKFPDKAIDILDQASSAKSQSQKISPIKIRLHKLKDELKRLSAHKKQLLSEEKYDKAELVQTQERHILSHIKRLEKKYPRTSQENTAQLTDNDVVQALSLLARVPVEKIQEVPHKRAQILNATLKTHIIGQEKAIKNISKTLLRGFAGLKRGRGPIGSFLLLGPTGVGKTHTATTLAQVLFDSPESLIRIDMSEFQERHSLAGLIGAPAGYVGHGEGGRLTEKVRRHPHSVVLFDEIEKAHPDILNILLQILEDGALTDAEGQTVSLAETIVILTSNIGTEESVPTSSLGFDRSSPSLPQSRRSFESVRENILRDLPKNIRPEILARLDDALVFEPLEKKHLRILISRELRALEALLKQRKNVTLSWDPQTVHFLLEKSLASYQGARGIQKHIQSHIENALAEHLLQKHAKTHSLHLTRAEQGIIIKNS